MKVRRKMAEENRSLEDALKQVESLRRDLSANLIQKEEGHLEEHSEQVIDSRWTWGSTPIAEKTTTWVLEKEIIKPDIEKRDMAMLELQKIYNSSKWFSIKHYPISVLLKIWIRKHPVAIALVGTIIILGLEYLLYHYLTKGIVKI